MDIPCDAVMHSLCSSLTRRVTGISPSKVASTACTPHKCRPPNHPWPRCESTKPQPPSDVIEQTRQLLQSFSVAVRQKSDAALRDLQDQLTTLGGRINEVTGYEEIERLKLRVAELEAHLARSRATARQAKLDYNSAVSTRSSAQRAVNSLLERKDRWSDTDVADFTTLIRNDHASTSAVTRTSNDLDVAEATVDIAFTDLTKAILNRYHEEQMWSEKIRSVSTWATFIGLVVNVIVFIGAIAVVEPWKRRKLAEGLEERIVGLMGQVERRIDLLTEEIGKRQSASFAATDQPLDQPMSSGAPVTETFGDVPPYHNSESSSGRTWSDRYWREMPPEWFPYAAGGVGVCVGIIVGSLLK